VAGYFSSAYLRRSAESTDINVLVKDLKEWAFELSGSHRFIRLPDPTPDKPLVTRVRDVHAVKSAPAAGPGYLPLVGLALLKLRAKCAHFGYQVTVKFDNAGRAHVAGHPGAGAILVHAGMLISTTTDPACSLFFHQSTSSGSLPWTSFSSRLLSFRAKHFFTAPFLKRMRQTESVAGGRFLNSQRRALCTVPSGQVADRCFTYFPQ
jgi:hypothetical protein